MTTEIRNAQPGEITQEADEFNASTDRVLEGVTGNLYTGHSLGWYEQYTPEQRYVGYLIAYFTAVDNIDNGTTQELEDEVIFLLAAASADDEAWQAGVDDAAARKAEGDNSGVQLFMAVYNTGKEGENPYYQYGNPDIDIPKIGGDLYKPEMMNRLQGVARGEDWYEPNNSFMPWQADPLHLGGIAKWMSGVIPGEQPLDRPPEAGDLFNKVATENKSPEGMRGGLEWTGASQGARGVAAVSALFAAGGIIKGLGVVGSAMSLAGSGVTIAEATSAANLGLKVAGGLNRFAQGMQLANDVRRAAVVGSAGYAAVNYGMQIGQARFGDIGGIERDFLGPLEQYQNGVTAGDVEQNEYMDNLVEIANMKFDQRVELEGIEEASPPRDRAQQQENNRFQYGMNR